MYYVCDDNGIMASFDNYFDARDFVETREDAWLSLDEDDEPEDIDSDFGFDPYEGCFTYDC